MGHADRRCRDRRGDSAASLTTRSGRHDIANGNRSASAGGALISPNSFPNVKSGRSCGGSWLISGWRWPNRAQRSACDRPALTPSNPAPVTRSTPVRTRRPTNLVALGSKLDRERRQRMDVTHQPGRRDEHSHRPDLARGTARAPHRHRLRASSWSRDARTVARTRDRGRARHGGDARARPGVPSPCSTHRISAVWNATLPAWASLTQRDSGCCYEPAQGRGASNDRRGVSRRPCGASWT